MKRAIPGAVVAVLLTIALFACNMGVGTMPEKLAVEKTEEGGAVPGEPDTGARVTIPIVSNRLLEALNATYEPSAGSLGAKAIMFATTVELELYQDGGPDLVDTWTLSDDLGLTDVEDGPAFTAFLAIDAGTDYTLEATIINNKVNTDPMVFAESAPFAILPGISTDVYMLGLPVQFSEMTTDGQSFNIPLVQAPYYFDGDGIVLTGVGGETWFEFSYTGGVDEYARLRAEPAGAGDAVLLIYDEDGAATEGMMDPPPMGWGMFDGGDTGTRAAFMGALEPGVPIVAYIGGALLNRLDDPSSQNVDYFFDILDRPPPPAPYTNVIEGSVEADYGTYGASFLPLSPSEEITQTIFYYHGGGGEEPYVHYFELEDIDWSHADLEDPITISISLTLDVLEQQHLFGMGYWPESFEYPFCLLTVGDSTDPAVTDLYAPLGPAGSPVYTVTENVDGSTTLAFSVDIATTGRDYAFLAISSKWMGNQFTLEWGAPGYGEVTIE